MKAAARFGAVSVISKTVRLGSVFFAKYRFGSVRLFILHVAVRCVSAFIPGFELMQTKLSNTPRA